MTVALRSPLAPMQLSPGMMHPPSRLCLSDIRYGVPCKFRALTILAALPRRAASYPLPLRQASALPSASSRFAVARDTLAVRLTLPLAGRVEDLHLQVSAPCRAHQNKGFTAMISVNPDDILVPEPGVEPGWTCVRGILSPELRVFSLNRKIAPII